MLTLTPGCACDVCAEEYGSNRPPHSIPCGHVLCASCIQTIIEKTNPRMSPVCPFCRETFKADGARLIRMDFGPTSGWTTPRRYPAAETLSAIDADAFTSRTAAFLAGPPPRFSRPPPSPEVRKLEDKIARIAAKKCSVEEVSMLYKELSEWLLAEKDDQTSSLFLSAALLRAILTNHMAHSDASKAAKTTEANLRHKIEDLELNVTRYEAELKKCVPVLRWHLPCPCDLHSSDEHEFRILVYLALFVKAVGYMGEIVAWLVGLCFIGFFRTQYTAKAQECARLHALATTIPSPSAAAADSSSSYTKSPSSPPPYTPHSTSTSPTPYSQSQSHYPTSSSASNSASTRFHARSASMSHSSASASASASAAASASAHRPTTPAIHPLSHSHSQQPTTTTTTTTSPTRSHTPAPRNHTPGPPASASAAFNAYYHSSSSSASMAAANGLGATPQRTQTPAGGLSSSASAQARSHTPSLMRSHTPSLMRSHTPAVPPVPAMPRYAASPAPAAYGLGNTHHHHHSSSTTPTTSPSRASPTHPSPYSHHGHSSSMSHGYSAYGLGLRAQTPGPAPLVPPKPRRLSLSGVGGGGGGGGGSPPRLVARTTSEEKAEAHQRWLPPSLGVGRV
ncbi:hypothetical protein BDN70DRAFT_939778 [Pholiota conissans]|uniref:RING-type domain-containing protein n=1 Tax=Pholiota conissans TaxID=109636 RepID=A0A9P6CQN1_9AGAR|nr:hypothetical protein BDN70DRAFT_939778 [Pholiota conissans]